jgi:hypothetical protein
MRASTSRVVYCFGLLIATACAVLPEALPSLVAEAPTAAPLTAEIRLARTIHTRLELETAPEANQPALAEKIVLENALRDLAFADDVAATRRDLILALTNELSGALADRTALSQRFVEGHPERVKADTVITGLTLAINNEVRRNRS